MRKLIERLTGRKAKERQAQEALERLDQRSDKGPEAFRRFEEATKQVVASTRKRER